jgi:hypothetical protein
MTLVPCLLGSKIHRDSKDDRVWKGKLSQCEELYCAHLKSDENMNCVYNCTSEACYEKVVSFFVQLDNDSCNVSVLKIYGSSPLEDGEIDETRWRDFTICLRREVRDDKKKTARGDF